MTHRLVGYAALAGFIGTVLAANYATTHYGLVPVGLGLTATAGTYLAGLAFVLRDTIHDHLGLVAVFAAIAAGAGLSYLVAAAAIATASGIAFAVSETADLLVYTPLRRHGYTRAAIASNTVGLIVDTYLFLAIAGFPLTRDVVAGQILAKTTITLAAVAVVVATRALLRHPQPASHP